MFRSRMSFCSTPAPRSSSSRTLRSRARLKTPEDPDGCTGVVVLPQATGSGRLIHAQNWDWKRECAETAVVLKVRRDDGPDLMTFSEAGALGRCGFNAVGIAITANYLQSDRDYRQVGVPLALIRRKVLENEHLALAMRAVYCTKKSAANNMIVSHREGVAIDFECAPDETFQVHPQNGLLVHANHFVSPVALGKLKDTGILEMPDSLYRDIRVRDLLQPHIGAISFDTVKSALFDEFAYPWSVSPSATPQSQQQSQRHRGDDPAMEPARRADGSGAAAGGQSRVHQLPARD